MSWRFTSLGKMLTGTKLDFSAGFYLPSDPAAEMLAIGARLVRGQLWEQPPVSVVQWPCDDLTETLLALRPGEVSIGPGHANTEGVSLLRSHLRLASERAVTDRYPVRVSVHCFSGVSMLVDVCHANKRGGWSGTMEGRTQLPPNASLAEVADALRDALTSLQHTALR